MAKKKKTKKEMSEEHLISAVHRYFRHMRNYVAYEPMYRLSDDPDAQEEAWRLTQPHPRALTDKQGNEASGEYSECLEETYDPAESYIESKDLIHDTNRIVDWCTNNMIDPKPVWELTAEVLRNFHDPIDGAGSHHLREELCGLDSGVSRSNTWSFLYYWWNQYIGEGKFKPKSRCVSALLTHRQIKVKLGEKADTPGKPSPEIRTDKQARADIKRAAGKRAITKKCTCKGMKPAEILKELIAAGYTDSNLNQVYQYRWKNKGDEDAAEAARKVSPR